jgi:phage protein D
VGDKLAAVFICSINGKTYQSGDGVSVSLESSTRDQELTQVSLAVWDGQVDGDGVPFPHFNGMPNPRCNPTIPFEAWIGWEDEPLYKVIEGYLTAKKVKRQITHTEFVGLHQAIKLRKRARVRAYAGMSVADVLKKSAAEEGCKITIDPSVAGDDALTMPAEVIFQLGEHNWRLMLRLIHEFGYISNTVKANEIVIRADKSSGDQIVIQYGDLIDPQRSMDLRYEQKRAGKSGKRKSHGTQIHSGLFWRGQHGADCGGKGGSKHTRIRAAQVPKHKKQEHIQPFGHASTKGIASRLAKEGDALQLSIRLRPEMKNEEVIVLQGFGPEISGLWETASVVHRIGHGPASTDIAAWRKG